MLFSATMPGPVIAMARQYMTKPMRISAADPEDASKTKASIRQVVYRAHHLDKDAMIGRILRATGRGRTIIFTKTKRDAARVAEELVNRGFAAAPLHGDLNQVAREQALKAFRTGKVDILVATDVAARGIDVDDVTHVINHRVPEDEKTYLHRTGRTGRAGNEGTAITLVDHQRRPRAGRARTRGDLLLLRAPLLRPKHSARYEGPPAPRGARGRGHGRRVLRQRPRGARKP